MAVIKPSLPLLLTIILLCLSGILWAQEEGYFLSVSHRFVQRLVWTADEYALHYEVIIEQERDGQFHRALIRRVPQESAHTISVDVSLPPGKYQYRIIPYDLFNRPSQGSTWSAFEVIPAIEPKPNAYSPGFFALIEDTGDIDEHVYIREQMHEYVLTISGSDLLLGAEIYLRSPGGAWNIVPVKIEIERDGSEARLFFNHDQFIQGFYEIFIKNPGGLEARMDGFFIGPALPPLVPAGFIFTSPEPSSRETEALDLFLGVAVAPIIRQSGSNSVVLGGATRFGMISAKPRPANIGLELAASFYWQAAQNQSFLAESNFLIRQNFPIDSTALVYRAGIGFILPVNSPAVTDQEPDPLNERTVYVNAGASFIFLFLKNFYGELGVNYSLLFAPDTLSGCLRPWICIGLKF